MDCPAATVFCDFDGTVTSIDTFDAVAALAAPQLWAELKAQLFQFEINLRQGMQALADGLNQSDLERMVAHMGQYALAHAFCRFLSNLSGLDFHLCWSPVGWCLWWRRCSVPIAIALTT